MKVYKTAPIESNFPSNFQNFSVYISYPHFYNGDPSLLHQFEGLNPQSELHETFVDLNERLGFPMNATTRFQINFPMRKEDFPNLKEDLIMPICWMELTPGKVPQEVVDKFYTATFTLNMIEMSIKCLSITVLIVSLAMFCFNVRYYVKYFKVKKFRNFYTVNS